MREGEGDHRFNVTGLSLSAVKNLSGGCSSPPCQIIFFWCVCVRNVDLVCVGEQYGADFPAGTGVGGWLTINQSP